MNNRSGADPYRRRETSSISRVLSFVQTKQTEHQLRTTSLRPSPSHAKHPQNSEANNSICCAIGPTELNSRTYLLIDIFLRCITTTIPPGLSQSPQCRSPNQAKQVSSLVPHPLMIYPMARFAASTTDPQPHFWTCWAYHVGNQLVSNARPTGFQGHA